MNERGLQRRLRKAERIDEVSQLIAVSFFENIGGSRTASGVSMLPHVRPAASASFRLLAFVLAGVRLFWAGYPPDHENR